MSKSEALALLPLAESIADGGPIDWNAVEAAANTHDRKVIRQLRVLSDLAGLHRSLPAEPGAVPPALLAQRAGAAPAIGSWAHLTLIERLGGGTSGEVYRAWDRHLEREVALKLLRVAEVVDDLRASRIANEGRLLARVRHANVITVHGVDAHDGRVGLWMDLVRGVTLEQQIAQHGPLSAREAAAVGIDLCRALAAIHAAGLIHRDVKAQNVMREDGGRIVLMDLGTGREADSDRRRAVTDLAGTPLYLAPEIFSGAPASERTDLYSLGVLLYHLVTGAFPVRATTIQELHAGHTQRRSVRLRDARADLPTSFVRVIDRAIAIDPDERYATAGAFEAALVQALDGPMSTGIPVAAPPQAAAARGRWWQWWTTPLALAAAVVAVLALDAIPWPFGRVPAPIRSIAVLPLTNLSGDASQEYFVDGMTELLIDNLAKIRALRVISRTSAMQYKGSHKSLKEIARALNVDAVLEGAVHRAGDRVRISADLVQVASDRHVWAESYDRDVLDILALQSEVARTIASAVQVQLTPLEQAGFALAVSAPQVDPAAQDAYLRGRYYWNKRTPAGLRQALEYFHQAARLAPGFALAYAGEADSYNLLPDHMAPAVAYPLAKAAATRALNLDPRLAEAHTSLAFATFVFDRNWAEAEQEFQRALEFNPGYATAHHWYAEYLAVMGRLDESFVQFEQASAIDPLSSAIAVGVGSTLAFAGRYDEAIARLRASLAIDANIPGAFYYLAVCYEQKGMLAEAAEETRHGLELAPKDEFLLSESGRLAALAGRREDAIKVAADLASIPSDGRISVSIAYVYAALGDTDRVFAALNRAKTERSPSMLYLKTDPMFAYLRGDPRFSDLLRQVDLGH